ncbi:MAG: signal peptidase I [Gemmatimonadaceae bacterium]|nr:signal peptidase I [Gemmatimonadaceae bacterium]
MRSGGRPSERSWWREWGRVLPAALILFLLLRTFVVEAFRIPSASMERTMLVGDFLLVNKWVYGAEVPFTGRRLPAARVVQHNDILVFDWPVDPSKAFVKRVVGLPGDTLAMRDGVLLRNQVPQQEPYAIRTSAGGEGIRNHWGPVVVPPAHVFVLGDNRENSLDSRYWGFVPDSLVRGAPWVVYFSYAHDTTQRFPWLTRIRWDRVGRTVR